MKLKNPISLLISFLLLTATCFSQSLVNRSNNTYTVQDSRFSAQLNFFVPRYADTTSANIQKGIDSLGAVIFTYDSMALWVRTMVFGSKQWKIIGSGVKLIPTSTGYGTGKVYAGYGLLNVNDSTVKVDSAVIATKEWVYDRLDSIPKGVSVIVVTKSQMDSTIDANGVAVGAYYKISGVHPALYDDGITSGTTIILQGIDVNKLSVTGRGIFYNPRYDNTAIGEWGVADIAETYNVGDTVIWGGYHWICTVSGEPNPVDSYSLGTGWTKLPYNAVTYSEVVDIIDYDYNNNWITRRLEVSGSNEVQQTKEEATVGSGDAISSFMWGNHSKVSGGAIVRSNNIYNSFVDIINFRGNSFEANSFSKFSIFYNNTFTNSGSFYSNTIVNSEILNNVISDDLYNIQSNRGGISGIDPNSPLYEINTSKHLFRDSLEVSKVTYYSGSSLKILTEGDGFLVPTTVGGSGSFTTTDARAAVSLTTTGTTGAATYNSSTGVLNIPNYGLGVTTPTIDQVLAAGDNSANKTLSMNMYSNGPIAVFQNIGSLTNTQHSPLRLAAQTSGTPAAGFGTALSFDIEYGVSDITQMDAVTIAAKLKDPASASLTTEVDIKGRYNKSATTFMNIQPAGIVRVNNNTDTLATMAYARSLSGTGGGPETDPVFTANGVKLTGNQNISGVKTFTDQIISSQFIQGSFLNIPTEVGVMSTPVTGGSFYVMTDNKPYFINDLGVQYDLTAAATLATGRTISLTGDVTYTSPSFNGSGNVTAAATVTRINGTALSGLATGILKNTTGTGVPSIAIAADFPTLNQNTTGSAATLTTGRTIALTGDVTYTSPSFNGSGNVTAAATVNSIGGKTVTLGGNFTTSGAFATTLTTTAATNVTLPTSGTLYGTATSSITSAQLAASLTDETGTGVNVFATSPVLVTPTLGVATATSINKVAFTAPATSATLTLANGSTLVTSGAFSTTLTATAATNVTLPTTGTLATLAGTETFTNKKITSRIGTTASSATPTPDANNHDQYNVTALAANATFAAPTGTPTDGQPLLIRIKDNGTARTLGFNTIYRAGTDIALPTTTVINKTMYLQFVYNAADSKWDFTGKSEGF